MTAFHTVTVCHHGGGEGIKNTKQVCLFQGISGHEVSTVLGEIDACLDDGYDLVSWI